MFVNKESRVIQSLFSSKTCEPKKYIDENDGKPREIRCFKRASQSLDLPRNSCLLTNKNTRSSKRIFSPRAAQSERPILAALFTFLDRQTLENINNCPEAKHIYQKSWCGSFKNKSSYRKNLLAWQNIKNLPSGKLTFFKKKMAFFSWKILKQDTRNF